MFISTLLCGASKGFLKALMVAYTVGYVLLAVHYPMLLQLEDT